jgi:DNA-binding MarR family transcriptional regulator
VKDLQQPIGYLIKQITDKIKVSADASLKASNLTLAQARVLEYILNKGGKVTQKSIEDYLDVSHPTVVGIVTRMEKSGYLTCYVDREDRRNKIVEITEQATLISQKMQEEREAQEQKLLRGLTEREVGNLYRMLSIIRKNV